ncbi:MAG: putative cytosol aminopeptidase, partial [Cyanobacteriota bacterium]
MEFRCIPDDLSQALASWQGDSLAVGLFASDGSNPPEPSRQWLENLLGASLNERLEQRRFKAKPGEILPIERLGATPQTLILVGLGEASHFDLSALRQAAAAAAQAASRLGARELGLALPSAGLPAATAAKAMAEAVKLSLFVDHRFKSESEPPALPTQVSLIGLGTEGTAGLAAVEASCAGVELARHLVAAPPNIATPKHLADTAAEIASTYGLELKVLERADCQALG